MDRGGLRLEGPNTAQFTTVKEALDRSAAALTSYEPVDGQAGLVGTAGTAEANAPMILVNETTGRTVTVLSKTDGSFSATRSRRRWTTPSAPWVNQNGTRDVATVSRQLFADGSVGLFSSGGTLEVTNENGVAQFTVEPGSIAKERVFKIQPVSLHETRKLLGHAQPTNGAVPAGFKSSGLRGSPLKHAIEINVPIDPAQLPLPPALILQMPPLVWPLRR
jgi:hypothetical protein